MKTQRAGSRFLKNLFVFSTVALLAVACGKENTSGDDDDSLLNGYSNYGTYTNGNGQSVNLQEALNIVGQERRCLEGGQRTRRQIQLQGNINIGAVHMGVSTYGDIAITANQGGQAVLDIYVCPRSNQAPQQVVQASQFILETSNSCPVAQISYGFATATIQGASFNMGFAPIHIPGTDRRSAICQN